MKPLLTLAAVLTLASLAGAQSYGSQSQATAPQPQTSGQKETAKRPPMAKSQEEYKAFLEIANNADPSAAEMAAREFEVKFPDSELKSMLFQQVMGKFQQANNADKTIEMGRKALQFDPDNVNALVVTSTVLALRTRETDIDRDERLKEAIDNAKAAIEQIRKENFLLSPSATPEQRQAFKEAVTAMAYDALGKAELLRKNDAGAEQYLRKALETTQGQQDGVTWLNLALALDHQNKYSAALEAANKAVTLSGGNPALANLAKGEQGRLKKLTAGTSAGTTSGEAKSTPQQTSPPPPPK